MVSKGTVLAADIGETNTRLRVSMLKEDGEITHIFNLKRRSGELTSIIDAFSEAIEISRVTYGISQIDAAVLALAGQVSTNRRSCAISYLNSDEYVDFAGLLEDMGVDQVSILNDAEGATFGIQTTPKEMFENIRDEKIAHEMVDRYVVAMPGSGLGVGFSLGKDKIFPSEGGNISSAIDFSDRLESTLFEVFCKSFGEASTKTLPTYDSICCGPGLFLITKMLIKEYPSLEEDGALISFINNSDRLTAGMIITRFAHGGYFGEGVKITNDEVNLARQAFGLVGRFLGRALQTYTLTCLVDVLYIGGLLSIENWLFMKEELVYAFQSHPRYKNFLMGKQIYLVKNPDLNLDGAVSRGQRLIFC